MAIQSGTHLGPYEIVSAIGGGMGEVYRARDPKLGRDVAIKVLPEGFVRNTERMAQFQREARVVAFCSRPNSNVSTYTRSPSLRAILVVVSLLRGLHA